MDQQSWVVTINGDQSEVALQASELERYILKASPTNIRVAQRQVNKHTQGGIIELLVVVLGPSGVVAYLIRALNTWIKTTHALSIDIEINDLKLKVTNITSKKL